MASSHAWNGDFVSRSEVRILAALKQAARAIAAHFEEHRKDREIRETLELLQRLDDHRLRDIGLRRCDLTARDFMRIAATRRQCGAVTTYEQAADSGNIVTRCFCPVCGRPVYSTNTRWPDAIVIRASSLDAPEVFAPQMVVCGSRRASWEGIDADLPRFADLPVMPEG